MTTPTPTHIYISGPMRGCDGFNFPAFFEAELALRVEFPEADICNPAREDVVRFSLQDDLRDDPTGLTAGRFLAGADGVEFTPEDLRKALAGDLAYICEHADLLVMLPGWENSAGAKAEAATAQALGTDIWEWRPPVKAERPADPDSGPRVSVSDFVTPAQAEVLRRRGEKREDESFLADRLLEQFDSETRVTSATGGQKGAKLAAFSQVSPEIERLVAEHFGKGALKYDAHNFRKGYPWSLSYDALRRHLAAFWSGKEYDDHLPSCPEGCTDHTGSLHIVAVIWHAMVLTEFFLHRKEYDDRYVYPSE